MDLHFTYLLVDLFCLFLPLLFSFFPAFKFSDTWRAFSPAAFISALFFILWDIGFTHLNVWSFNPAYVLPFRILNLPLEEMFFFICIPYACVFTYYCVKKYLKINANPRHGRILVYTLAACLLIVAVLNFHKLYTSVSFSLLAMFLIFLLYKKVSYLMPFFLSYVLVLPFFFLTNGILTGSFISEPVVIYNPQHHLGLRLFTIPVEDTFYGMLLILMNVSLYEYFGKSKGGDLP